MGSKVREEKNEVNGSDELRQKKRGIKTIEERN